MPRSQFRLLMYFLLWIPLFQLLIVSTESLVMQKASGYGYDESCFYWIKHFRSVSIRFCTVEPDDSLIKMISNVLPVTVDNNAQNTLRVAYSSTNQPMDFVIFTDSNGTIDLEDCVSESIPSFILSELRSLIVCDKSPGFSWELKKMDSLKFLGLASVLYVSTTQCWSATPFYLLSRTFIRQPDCYSSSWKFESKSLPDMGGQSLRVVTFNKSIFSVIKQNETIPESK